MLMFNDLRINLFVVTEFSSSWKAEWEKAIPSWEVETVITNVSKLHLFFHVSNDSSLDGEYLIVKSSQLVFYIER